MEGNYSIYGYCHKGEEIVTKDKSIQYGNEQRKEIYIVCICVLIFVVKTL